MSDRAEARIRAVLAECAEVPVDPEDAELAALAVAIHVEESLRLTVPRDLLDHQHLVPPAALARTLRLLTGAG